MTSHPSPRGPSLVFLSLDTSPWHLPALSEPCSGAGLFLRPAAPAASARGTTAGTAIEHEAGGAGGAGGPVWGQHRSMQRERRAR